MLVFPKILRTYLMDDPKEILKNIFMERDGQIFLNVEFAIASKTLQISSYFSFILWEMILALCSTHFVGIMPSIFKLVKRSKTY